MQSVLRASCALLAVIAVGLVGCDGEITDSDLLKWTHNDVGLAKITEVVADPEVPIDTRVKALEVVTTRGFPLRVHRMLTAVADEDDRRELANRLAERLLTRVDTDVAGQLFGEHAWIAINAFLDDAETYVGDGSSRQVDAKDALLALGGFLGPERWATVQEAVAEWAFGDIDWESSDEEIRAKMQRRMHAGQILETGRYGWETAAVLISRGYALDDMVRFLGAADAPEAVELLLKALRARHEDAGAQLYQIQALRDTESPAAVEYLFEMYMNEGLDQEVRATAFNQAVAMLELEPVRAKPERVERKLLELSRRDDPDDRWQAATSMLRLGSVDKFAATLAAFKDDELYAKSDVDPARSLQDFCLDVHDMGIADEVNPVFMEVLEGGNRVVQAIAIACLKANRGYAAREALGALAERLGRRDDVAVADIFGEELTLGTLAQNAIDGLEMLAVLDREKDEGKHSEEEYEFLRQHTFFELALVGDIYRRTIDARFEYWKEQIAAAEEEAKRAEEEGDGDGDGDDAEADGAEADDDEADDEADDDEADDEADDDEADDDAEGEGASDSAEAD